jgi:hypothetical protein
MSKDQILLIAGVSFLVMIAWGMRIKKKQWAKLSASYPTDLKIPMLTNNRKIINIDEALFKNISIEILPVGLLMGMNNLIPRIFIPDHVLIPWKAFTPFQRVEKKILLFTITVSSTDIKTPEGKVKLHLPNEIVDEILSEFYVKEI